MIRLAIAEDRDLMLQGLVMLLKNLPSITITHTAHDGYELLDGLKVKETDVVLLDIGMPNMDGLETMKVLAKEYPALRVLVLTNYNDQGNISQMLEAGAKGYVLKDIELEDLKEAIEKVYGGEEYYSEEVTHTIMQSLKPQKNKTKNGSPHASLTKREKEVLKLVIEGMSTPMIAEALFISQHTVITHRKNMMSKLGVGNTAELVRKAIEHGMV